MHIVFLIAKYGRGGVERMMVNIASGLASLGHRIQYLAPAEGVYLSHLDGRVQFLALPEQGRMHRRYLAGFLRSEQPECLLVAKDRDLAMALSAKKMAASTVKVVMRPGTAVSARLNREFPLKQWIRRHVLVRRYRRAAAIVANSEAVRQDVASVIGVSPEQIYLIRNPVISRTLVQQAQETVAHPWLAQKTMPVILGVGNLHRVKDFATLIEAFGLVRRHRPARLIILGEGHLKEDLRSQAERLGIGGDVDLPGFIENPYPFLKTADVYVLSSIREGSPNALTEALALGTPVVATDCPGGVREILQDGRYGSLVAPGSPVAMANAILDVFCDPPPRAMLQEAVAGYTLEENAKGYAALFSGLNAKNGEAES
jgi:glycosyltransferase involved in cell wall biosynthesis